MAAGGNLGQEEMTCPVCHQRFLDPVITDCGHSFCHACLIQSWRDSEAAGCCPQCEKPFKEGSYKRKHELARHAGEPTKPKEGEDAKSKEGRCDKPEELPELSCEGDDAMVRGNEGSMILEGMSATTESAMLVVLEEDINCPICKEYLTDLVTLDCGHNFCKACISHHCETWEEILKCPVCQAKIQKGNYRPNWQLTNIVENCKRCKGTLCERHKGKLILFCKEDRELLCSKCAHSPQHSQHSLVLLQDIEQEIRRTMNRSKHEEEVVNRPNFEESLNICSQRNSALIKITEKMEGSINLDPGTAYPYLIVSDDLKSVRWGDGKQDVPRSSERFHLDPCVLGYKRIGSGRHWWVVEVGMEVKEEEAEWAVGVVRESFQRKGNGKISLNPHCGIWAVGKERNSGHGSSSDSLPPCCLWAFTSPKWTVVRLERLPRKIKVSLDYEERVVEFFDADLDKPIFKFCPAFFQREMLIPYLFVGKGVTLKC